MKHITYKQLRVYHFLGILSCLLAFSACDHGAQRELLIGYWEGEIPNPTSGQQIPIAYDFRQDGLTVTVGLGEDATVIDWDSWRIDSVIEGDLRIRILRLIDNREFESLARFYGDDELHLWDVGTEHSSAAVVHRMSPAENEGSGDD